VAPGRLCAGPEATSNRLCLFRGVSDLAHPFPARLKPPGSVPFSRQLSNRFL